MSDTRLTTVSKEVFISERPILWQAYLELREFSKAQMLPAAIMSLAAFIAAFLTGQVTSVGSAALFVVLSVLAGLVLYGLLAISRAPFIVIGQQHRQIAELNQRLLKVEQPPVLPAALLSNTPKEKSEPNLICLRCESVKCLLSPSGILVEASDDAFIPEDNLYYACVAIIDNQSIRSRRVGPAHNVTARLRYKDGSQYEIPRGAWLSEDDSKVTFYPSRSHPLILAVVSAQAPGSGLQSVESKYSVRGFTHEMTPFLDDKITVEVMLETEGMILEEWGFALVVENSGFISAHRLNPALAHHDSA